MIDQTSQFFAILTNVGAAKQANADALGIPWKITQMGVGDANGADPIPSATQTALINERRRAPLNQLKVDPANSAVIIAEQVIPAEVGGWWIREIGLYDADNDLVAIANCAPSFKPLLTQGSGRTQVVRMNLVVSNSATVELKIDPSVVLATRAYVDQKVLDELNRQDFKFSVYVATTAPIALNGLPAIDGESIAEGARVLVKNQVLPRENGIYVAGAGGWVRAQDADISIEVTPGLLVHVERGTTLGDSIWQLVTNAPIVLGTTDLVFEMAAGRTGVAVGTYTSVTVDKYGRVIAATSPTTLAGYGITLPTQLQAETGTDNALPMTPLRVFQAIAKVVGQATEALFGWAKVATQTQTNSGVDDTTMITPKKFSAGIAALVIQATEAITGIAKVATQTQTNSGIDDTTMITPKKFSAGIAALVIQATEAITGIAKIGTQSQVNAGVDDTTIVTPKKLRLGFSILLAINGYIVFPTWMGGLIIQWGRLSVAASTTTAFSLPIPFPTTFFAGMCQSMTLSMSTTYTTGFGLEATNLNSAKIQNNYSGSALTFGFIAIGN